MQVLLFSAAWLVCDRRTLQHRGTAFTAGLFFGLLQAIHVDGLAFVLGLPIFGGFCWVRAEVLATTATSRTRCCSRRSASRSVSRSASSISCIEVSCTSTRSAVTSNACRRACC